MHEISLSSLIIDNVNYELLSLSAYFYPVLILFIIIRHIGIHKARLFVYHIRLYLLYRLILVRLYVEYLYASFLLLLFSLGSL